MKISEIKIGNRFRKDLGNIDSLVRSIKEVGLLHPIVVSEKGELIAGYRRLKACESLGWEEIPTTTINLSDLQKGEIQENMVRKDFTISEMVAIKRAFEPEIKTEHPVGRPEKGGNFPQLNGQKTRDVVGSFVGVSGKTLEKAEAIVEAVEHEPEKFQSLLEHVESGQTSISYAFKMVKRSQDQKIDKPLPDGQFNVIYADPPWQYNLSLRGSPDEHYPTMDMNELLEMKIPSNEDAILFLWATNPKLKEALMLMEAWGFQYKTNLVWVKDQFGNGYYFRGQHELLLLGIKGKIGVPFEGDRPSSVLMSPRLEHSKKPTQAYEIIERMYPQGHYLELFATEKRANWESWGNAV